MRFEDLTGQRFNRLLVIERTDGSSKKHTYWKCRCDCGKETVVASQKLKNGRTKSCGCYSKDRATKHGKQNTRIYKIWRCMKSRCSNPRFTAYERYGGRGIKVCEEWRNSFEAFYEWAMAHGYSNELTIDRIDNDGDYRPENCRWITMKEQSNNTSANHIIEYNGETHTISEWSDILHISKKTLANRIDRGWEVDRAFTEPVHTKRV